jgi:futalosine hydrolase
MPRSNNTILVAAATETELCGLEALELGSRVIYAATGAGAAITAINLCLAANQIQPAFVLAIGIAGSYGNTAPIGTVARLGSDRFADLGIETQHGFTPIEDYSFCHGQIKELHTAKLDMPPISQHLPVLPGYTFNTAHGREATIAGLGISHGLESMEGAAFALACRRMQLPMLQLRAVSNKVEARNTAAWNIPKALENLRTEAAAAIRQALELYKHA